MVLQKHMNFLLIIFNGFKLFLNLSYDMSLEHDTNFFLFENISYRTICFYTEWHNGMQSLKTPQSKAYLLKLPFLFEQLLSPVHNFLLLATCSVVNTSTSIEDWPFPQCIMLSNEVCTSLVPFKHGIGLTHTDPAGPSENIFINYNSYLNFTYKLCNSTGIFVIETLSSVQRRCLPQMCSDRKSSLIFYILNAITAVTDEMSE